MNQKKVKLSIFLSIIIYFVIYFIATVYESNFWGNILSPIGPFIAAIVFFYVFKKSPEIPLIWLFLSMDALIWSITDIAWAVCEMILGLDPDKMSIFNVLYLFPNIFLLMAAITFFIKMIKKLNRIQLLLDITAISLSCMTIFWIILMRTSVDIFIQNTNNIILFLYMITDFFIIVSGILFFVSIRKGKIPSGMYFTFLSGIFYAIIDIVYSYIYFYGLYIPNSIIDSAYVLSFLLQAYGGILVLKENNCGEINKFYLQFENSGKNRRGLVLLLCPVILIIYGEFKYSDLIFLISIYVLYQALSNYVQNAMQNEKLLIKEKI